MSDKDLDKYLMDHNYDGIQELDNPMPTWWLITFYATIIFGILYFLHYEVSKLSTSDSELKEDMAKIEMLKNKAKESAPKADSTSLAALLTDKEALAAGKKEYMKVCAACHGNEGQGLIGPNLADKHWKNGKGKLVDLVEVIDKGVPEKGMPAWGALLKTQQVHQVAAYVKSLQGTSPPNPKAPEGELVQ